MCICEKKIRGENCKFLFENIIYYEKLGNIVYRNNRVICEEEILCQNHLD